MTNQTANSGEKQKQRDPDLAAAETVMKRAAPSWRAKSQKAFKGNLDLSRIQLAVETAKDK